MRRYRPLRPTRPAKLLAIPLGLALGWLAWHPSWIANVVNQQAGKPAGAIDDDAALQALVAQLNSTRAKSRAAACQALQGRIASWELLAARQAKPHMLKLAGLLAAQANVLHPQGARLATELATQMLNWQVATRTQSQQLLLACDHVLHASLDRVKPAAGEQVARRAWRATDDDEINDATSSQIAKAARGKLLASEKVDGLQIPGGGLPIELLDNLRSARDTLREFASDEVARPLAGVQQESQPSKDTTADTATNIPTSESTVPSIQQPARLVTPASLTRLDENGQLVERMCELHHADPVLAEAAAAALRKLGFSHIHLELARQLTADDPQVRKQLAETLPGVPGIDAEVWLTWLAIDSDAPVRLAALTVMATTTDPKMLKRVSQLAREDDDPRIQELGERLSNAGRPRR